MIAVRDLSFRYPGGFALEVPAWDVADGAVVGVMGPSGCGKSTLLGLLSGELLPEAGTVEVAGTDVPSLSDGARRAWRIRHVGFVFQDHPLITYLDAAENVLLPYRLHPALRRDAAVVARADRLLEDLGLGDKRHRRPDQLSQGERQRVAIARALVTDPPLVLADEATTGLDEARTDAVMDLLTGLATDRGATLVMVTHDRRLAGRFDDVLTLGEP